MNDEKSVAEMCVICKRNPIHSRWIYIWEGQSGSACETCGGRFHELGDYLIEQAGRAMTNHGILVEQVKEKFGEWRIYYIAQNDEQEKFAQDLKKFYQTLFPQFEWSW